MNKLKLKIIEQTFCHCEYSNNPMPPVSFSDNIEWDRNVSYNEELVFYTDRDIIRGDKPPYYLVPEVYEKNTGMSYKNFDLPYNAGRCTVSWPNNKMQFEWRLANG